MKKPTPLKGFLELCLSCKNEQELSDLFELFMTFEEREMLSSRYLILQHLLKGKISQREMSKKLHLSIAQITRGSNALKIIPEKLRKKLTSHFEGFS